jgi:hypothetical protein
MGQEDSGMPQFTQILAGCTDGPCPKIAATTDPAMLGVQGYQPTPQELAAMGLPEGETVIWVPRAVLDEYAASLR